MLETGDAPPHWYKYPFPLEENKRLPEPSGANYEPKNVAWLIEFFANALNRNHTDLTFRYENNTPQNPHDDIFVSHPNDKLYWPEKQITNNEKSKEQTRYEEAARKSDRLRLFQDNSPAGIQYFQSLG